MEYTVKTRNWNCNSIVAKLLASFGQNYGDNDIKAYYQTNSLFMALIVWIYFMALKPFSGGWTYIRNNNKYPDGLDNSYRMFYL